MALYFLSLIRLWWTLTMRAAAQCPCMRALIYHNNLKYRQKKMLLVENRCLLNDKDTAWATPLGISKVPCRKLNRLACGGAGPQLMGGEWKGARLIGFATESDYTLLTPGPSLPLYMRPAQWRWHTLARSLFYSRLEAGGWRTHQWLWVETF